MTQEEKDFLKEVRNYFGKNDKTPFEHAAYGFLNNLLNQQPPLEAWVDQKIFDTWDTYHELIGEDIDSLQYVAGKKMMCEKQFNFAVKELILNMGCYEKE